MNKSDIIALLSCDNVAVEKAMLALQAEQTEDERATRTTSHTNGRGWNAREAAFAGSLCEQIERSRYPKGSRLSPRQMECARKMCKGHATQLANLGVFGPTSVLGIEDRFFRPISEDCLEQVFTPLGHQGMKALVMDFDPFYCNI